VVEQDYSNKRIMVIDDGSKDNSYEAVIGMSDGNVAIPPESHENLNAIECNGVSIFIVRNSEGTGPSAARNKGIELMWEHTDYFCMLDADDEYLPGKLSKSVAKMDADPGNIGIVYTDALIRNVQKNTIIQEFRQPYSREALEQECIISNTPLINKASLEKHGLYDVGMRTAEDWDLWLRITDSFMAVHIPEPLHIYSVTGRNSSDVVPPEVWQRNWQIIRERLAQRYGRRG
jgi:glycosyltransferase involved in cell wall biosynthesis